MKRDNLELLIKHLKTLPEEALDMSHFSCYPNYDEEVIERVEAGVTKNICGTTGCIIGHAPEVIALLERHIDHGTIEWSDYSEYVSGLEYKSLEWEWCFGAYWSNSIEQACERIQHLLDGKEILESQEDWVSFGYCE